ncbi:putative F-box protein At3g23420 [Lolium perenne]|uniref:putative F-box protein At3g23420 n=1 Tax=Lolium perenne TaxID=4522 RepID=UPI003A9A0BD2
MNRSKVPVAETGLALPPEVVEQILLRVPGRQLRRLRAVCRSWRSLLSDPSFLKMHAAFHPAIILALAENDNHIDVVDFSGGHIIKQIRVPATSEEEEAVLPTNPGSSFLFQANNRIHMVDPDSGAVFTLPSDDLGRLTLSHPVRFVKTDYVLGRAASTRHHKVLRILTGKAVDRVDRLSSPFKQLCHVLTLGDDDDNRQWQCWRERPSPPMFVKSNVDFHGVNIHGSVFFLAGDDFTYCDTSYPCNRMMYQTRTDSIASFDLEKEQWRPATLRGPPEC